MSETIYEETVPAGRLVVSLFGAVLLLLLGLAIFFLWQGPPASVLLAAAFFVGLLLVFWNFRAIRIRVDDESFRTTYGVLNRTTIPLDRITSCEPTQASFGRYFGIGVRLGTDGSRAYTTSFGKAAEIRSLDSRPFVVSTHAPEDLCRALRLQRSAKR